MDLQQNIAPFRTKSSTSKQPVNVGEDMELSDTSDDNAPKITSRKSSFRCPDPFFGSFTDDKTSSSAVGKNKKINMNLLRRRRFSSDEDSSAAVPLPGRNSTIVSSVVSQPTIASTSTSCEFSSLSSHSESLCERQSADGLASHTSSSVDEKKATARTRPKIKKSNLEQFEITENDSDDDLFVPDPRRKLPPSIASSKSNGARLKAPQEESKRSAKVVVPLLRKGTETEAETEASSASRKPTSADVDFFDFFDTMLDIPTAVSGKTTTNPSHCSGGSGRQKEKRKVKRKAADADASSREAFFDSLFSRDYSSTSSGDMDLLTSDLTSAVGKDRGTKTKTSSTKARSHRLRRPSNGDDLFFSAALIPNNEVLSNSGANGGNSPAGNRLDKKDGIIRKSSIGSSSDGGSVDKRENSALRHDEKVREQTAQTMARRKSGSGEGAPSFNTTSSTGFAVPNGKASVPALARIQEKSSGRKYSLNERVSDAETAGQSGSRRFGSSCSAFSRIGPDGGTSGDAARNTSLVSVRRPEAFDFNLPRTLTLSRSEAAVAAAAVAAAAGNSNEDSQANDSNEEHPPPPPPSPRSRIPYGRRPMHVASAAVDNSGSRARPESAKGEQTVSRFRFVRPRTATTRTATAVANVDEFQFLAPPERPVTRDRDTVFRSPGSSSRRMMLDSTEEEDLPAQANGDGGIDSRRSANAEPAASRPSMSEVGGIFPRGKLRKKHRDGKSGMGSGAGSSADIPRPTQPRDQWDDLNDIFDDESLSDVDNREQNADRIAVENPSRLIAAASAAETATPSNELSSSDSAKKSKKKSRLRSAVRAANGAQTRDASNAPNASDVPAPPDMASMPRFFHARDETTSRPTRSHRISMRRILDHSAAMSRVSAESSRAGTREVRRSRLLEEEDDSNDDLWSLSGNPSNTNVGNAGRSPECIEITSSDSDSSSDNDVIPVERNFFPQVDRNHIRPTTQTFFRPLAAPLANRSSDEDGVRSAFTNVSAGSRNSSGFFRLPGLTSSSADTAAGAATGTEFDTYHCRLLLERIRNFSNYQWELHVALRDGLDAPAVPADYSGPQPDSLVDAEVLEYMVHCQQNGLEIPRPHVSRRHSARNTSPTSHRRRVEAFRRMTSRVPASESTTSLNPLNVAFTEVESPVAGSGLADNAASFQFHRRPRLLINRLHGRRPNTASSRPTTAGSRPSTAGSGTIADAAAAANRTDVAAAGTRVAAAIAAARTRSDFAAATASAATAAAAAARTASAAAAADAQARSFGSIFFQPLLSYMMNGEIPPGNAATVGTDEDINVNNVLDNIFGRIIDGDDRHTATGRRPQRGRRGSTAQRQQQRQQRVFLHFDIDGLDDYEHLVNLIEGIGEVSRGLDRSDIEKLPVKTFAKSELAANDPVPECNICISEYEDGEQLRILQCFHKFHAGCIDKWLQVNRSCPTCREQVQV